MPSLFSPFIMLCLAGLVSRLGYQMARSPVLPRFAEDLGAAPELIGIILGASTVTGIFIKFPAGAFSDLLGRRRMLILGAAFFAFPPFLYLFVADPYTLMALRFLHGFATAIFSPVASAAVADLFEKERGERMGWFASSSEVGSAAAPLIGGILLSFTASNYSAIFLIVGVLGVVTFILTLRLPESPAKETSFIGKDEGQWHRFRKGTAEVLRNKQILIASSVEAGMFLGVGALVGFLPLYATRVVGLTDAEVGVVLGCQLITAMAGKPITGRLSDRFGRKPMIVLGTFLCALILPLVSMTRSFVLLILEGVLFGLGMAVVTPSTTALVADLAKSGGYGAALGVFGTVWDIGEAMGPILAGILVGIFSQNVNPFLPTFGIVSGILVYTIVAFALLVREPALAQVKD